MMDLQQLLTEMWNAFYEAEDEHEKQYVGTDKSDDWFLTYRPWMQRGFDIAIDVISKEKERANNFVSLRSTSPCGQGGDGQE